MKRAISNKAMTACAVLSASLLSTSHAAENLLFDGSDPALLQTVPGLRANSLFPSGSADNTVTVTGGDIAGDVVGAFAVTGNVGRSTTNVSGGTIGESIYGGYTLAGDAVGSTVNFTGGHTLRNIFGGRADAGDATHNVVNVIDGIVDRYVYGGRAVGNAIHNTVNVAGGRIGQNVIGGQSNSAGNASNNSVTMTGGIVNGGIFGGNTLTNGSATKNVVNMEGGSAAQILGGRASDGNASDNIVIMSGGSVAQDIYGGQSTSAGDASNNSVNITGGIVGRHVYGGRTADGNATGNTVTLGSGAQLAAVANIRGGYGSGDVFTGNVLNLQYSGAVANIENFEYLNFGIPAWMQDGQTQLSTTSQVNLDNTHITVGVMGGGTPLNDGDIITLFDNSRGAPASFYGKAKKGVSLVYDVILIEADPSLQVKFSAPEINPETKSLNEGRAVQVIVNNLAADLAAGQAMRNAVQATRAANGAVAFGAVTGGKLRYDTDADIELNGGSLLIGAGSRSEALMLGGFIEAGTESYNTINRFGDDAAAVAASGKLNYVGLGLLARYDMTTGSFAGGYVDGALRFGRSQLSYASNDLCDVSAQCASYASNVNYVGGHIGLGYALPVNDRAVLSFDSRYLVNRLGGSAADVVGDPIVFNAATSSRWRNGLRLDYSMPTGLTPYVSAAYEYEFDGKMPGTAYAMEMAAADMQGGTTIAEAGLHFRREEIQVNLALQAFSGQRRGMTALIGLQRKF